MDERESRNGTESTEDTPIAPEGTGESPQPGADPNGITPAQGESEENEAEAEKPENDVHKGDEVESEGGQSIGALFSEGVAGVRELGAARRAHAEARTSLEQLLGSIEARESELEHRREVERDFDSIVRTQSTEIERAAGAKERAEADAEALSAKISEQKALLDKMKDEDATTDRRLRSAREAAEAKESSARESGNRLARRVEDARKDLERCQRERKEGLEAGKRSIEGAKAHLNTLRTELEDIRRTPSANPAEYSVRSSELEREIAQAQRDLEAAEVDLPRIDAETSQAIEDAKQAIEDAQKPIAAAKAKYDQAASEAEAARNAYAEAREDAEARQKELKQGISKLDRDLKELKRTAEEEQRNREAAQTALDEARDIHAHPEQTEQLASALEEDRRKRDALEVEIERLAAAENDVRKRTRSSRLKFGAIIAAAIAVIILIAVLIASQIG